MSDTFEWISPGFGLRTRDGKKSYVVQYKIGNQQRRMTLGSTTKLTREQAKKEAKKIFGKVAEGIDPQAVERAARTSANIGTFKAIAQAFVAHQKETRRASTAYRTELYLLTYAKELHGLTVEEIRRSHIATVLMAISKKHGRVSADRARAAFSAAFAWAIGEGLCGDDYANPVTGSNRQSKPTARDRVLKDQEVAEIWNACGDDDFGRICKLLLLTGCRRNEIADLEWSEVDGDLITLPAERTKNHLSFDVPLSAAAQAVLGTKPDNALAYVFGSRRFSGFSGFSKAKRELDAKLKNVKPWRLHDLRRTLATRMGDNGVQPHIIEAVLNHVSGHKAGVAGVYNRATYAAEKREAVEIWATRIAVILGKNVTDLAQARKRRAGEKSG